MTREDRSREQPAGAGQARDIQPGGRLMLFIPGRTQVDTGGAEQIDQSEPQQGGAETQGRHQPEGRPQGAYHRTKGIGRRQTAHRPTVPAQPGDQPIDGRQGAAHGGGGR